MALRAMSNRIHVLINGEQFGPYPEGEFRQHVDDKKILRSDLVWREGLADWIPAGELLDTIDAARCQNLAPSPQAVFERLRAAADKRNADAQFEMPGRHERGEGAPLNRVEAAKWWRQAAQRGHARAAFQLSLALASGSGVVKSDEESNQWLRQSAEAGHAEAQYTLGRRHANGEGAPQSDVEAVIWFQKAAEQHHAVAQSSLGYMFDHGRG